MKILVDKDIVYAKKLFSLTGKVLLISGRDIPREMLNNSDALIVRSVTTVNKELLSKTSIKFVGTATSGIDHIDHNWLQESGIVFSAAFGCNAISVVEYIFSALFSLSKRDNFKLCDRVVGIIGVGNIGGCLQKRLTYLGVKTILCDPIYHNQEKKYLLQLNKVIKESNIISFHTPLIKNGLYKSWHLVNTKMLMSLNPKTILINTSRGSVIDNLALLQVLKIRKDISVILDVWENERKLSIDLINKVDIATAHIAGYSIEGKIRGIVKIFKAWNKFIGQKNNILITDLLPKTTIRPIKLYGVITEDILRKLVHLIYDVKRDDKFLRKKILSQKNNFDSLRKNYIKRREWSSLKIICDNKNTFNMLVNLGFNAYLQT